MANKREKIKSALKETWRKFLVSLKRNPQYIPIASLLVSFMVFSLNLTDISNTTAKIYGENMGFYAFLSMLLSLLSFVCMLGAYPKRQKPNIFMIALMLVMYGIVIYADYGYFTKIVEATTRANNPIIVTTDTMYIYNAQIIMLAHIALVALTIVCVILEPLFAKLLRKINTSIDVADNGEIANIDLTEE